MRIGVDLTFYTGTRGGMETYVRDLYTGLGVQHPSTELMAITTQAAREPVSAWFPGHVHVTRVGGTSSPGWAAAETLGVAPVVRGLGVDVLHCPANLAASRSPVPIVLTLHDVNVFRANSPASVTNRVTRILLRRSARVAAAVITDSEWSADEIRLVLPSIRAPITVIPPVGPAHAPGAPSVSPAFLGDAPCGRSMVLAGGNRLPHKNWDGLLRALQHIPPPQRPLLVLTGDGGSQDPLVPLIAELDLSTDVVLTGWTTQADLEWLYQNASLYVLPTRYEGFGLGVLEAMARGLPVLASDIPVLREVGGSAIQYVDSRDSRAMADRIVRVLRDPSLRTRMSDQGQRQALEFPWEQSVDRTWHVLRRAVGGQVSGP